MALAMSSALASSTSVQFTRPGGKPTSRQRPRSTRAGRQQRGCFCCTDFGPDTFEENGQASSVQASPLRDIPGEVSSSSAGPPSTSTMLSPSTSASQQLRPARGSTMRVSASPSSAAGAIQEPSASQLVLPRRRGRAVDPSEVSSTGDLDDFSLQESDTFWPVQAYYVARYIDTKRLLDRVFPGSKVYNNATNSSSIVVAIDYDTPMDARKYMVVYSYGAIVGFKLTSREMQRYIDLIGAFGDTAGLDKDVESSKVEEYQLVVRPELPSWSKYDPRADFMILQTLDINNVRIISSVLALSVALNHYERRVEEVLNRFGVVNNEMQLTGTFTLQKKQVFQLVATINNVFTDALHKIRVLERSETAWKSAKYSEIWETLRDEFEIENRYDTMKDKLDLVQLNLRFFLEVMQNKKADFLEWIIIVLIAVEIGLSVYRDIIM
eukprot:jgi/Chlat1/5265/Chrsp33S05093